MFDSLGFAIAVVAADDEAEAEAALVASIMHYGTYSIKEIKEDLKSRGVEVRL